MTGQSWQLLGEMISKIFQILIFPRKGIKRYKSLFSLCLYFFFLILFKTSLFFLQSSIYKYSFRILLMWHLPNHHHPQKPLMQFLLFLRSAIKPLKQRHQSLKSEIPERQSRFLSPSHVGEKERRRKIQSLALDANGAHAAQLLNPSVSRTVEPSSQEMPTLQEPRALAQRLVFSICHLSPFINNHLPQEWHISKAIPSSLVLPSSTAPRSGGNSVINAQPQATLSLPAPVSFPSLIKKQHVSRPSLVFPFISLSLFCKGVWSGGGGCLLLHGIADTSEYW